MVVMLPKQKTNSYVNYGLEQCWVSLITTSSSYLKKSKSKNHWFQAIGKKSESKNCWFQLFRKPQRTDPWVDIFKNWEVENCGYISKSMSKTNPPKGSKTLLWFISSTNNLTEKNLPKRFKHSKARALASVYNLLPSSQMFCSRLLFTAYYVVL